MSNNHPKQGGLAAWYVSLHDWRVLSLALICGI